jgi:hypothetical protein
MTSNSNVERTLIIFEAHCIPNGHQFEVYDFSEFAYGERLIRTHDGQHCALLTLRDDVVKEVGKMLANIYQNRLDEIEQADRFDKVFGLSCDSLDGKNLDASVAFICPVCGNPDVDYHEAKPARSITLSIPAVTHEIWRRLTEHQKRTRIEDGLRARDLL